MDTPTYRTRISDILDDLRPTIDKIHRRYELANETEFSNLSERFHQSVVTLHLQEFDLDRDRLELRLSQNAKRADAFCHDTSSVMLVGDHFAGFLLTLPVPETSAICVYSLALEPDWRNTWACAKLKFGTLEKVANHGYRFVEFQAYRNSLDTKRHAQRIGASRR